MKVHLKKPAKGTTISYESEVVTREDAYILVHARWDKPALELPYVTFETGDHFYEHYYTDRWYNVFEIRSAIGALKGWYCNVTRPAVVLADTLESEDLELDLFVSPDRQTMLTLDMDEFEALQLEPEARTAALAALEELQRLARAGDPPFDAS